MLSSRIKVTFAVVVDVLGCFPFEKSEVCGFCLCFGVFSDRKNDLRFLLCFGMFSSGKKVTFAFFGLFWGGTNRLLRFLVCFGVETVGSGDFWCVFLIFGGFKALSRIRDR